MRLRDSLRRIRALVRKETRQILRDPSSILIAFILPILLLFLFGYGVSLDTKNVRVGLVVESPSPVTASLAGAFRGTPYFQVSEGRDRREFEDSLMRGHLRGIVVVPKMFTEDLAAGRRAAVQVLTDGTDPNTAKFVQAYTEGTVALWLAGQGSGAVQAPAGLTVEQRFWFNPELASRFFLVPGAIAIVLTLVGTLLTSLVVAREWERGTMEAMMATPVSALEIVIGKLVPYFILGLASVTLCLVLATLVFQVPFRGSFFALYLLAAVFLLPSLGLGLLISSLTKNQFLASQIALLSGFLPAFLLSGFLFQIGSMPVAIRFLTAVVPARHLVPSLSSVFLAGDIWPMYLEAIAILALMGAVLLTVSVRMTRKRID
ncbi:ABC transporter permease [Phaeovibrio sulfidiphilus]|uniref:ABC transporter permease n=1 Tax=Phaeovibrio sulfidiphilus TaxID=1220600 RepID=A0A8J6YNB7_9PROT|nr:ABC transporter permease [Phaeovibrio sulfidiphilus]MBE1237795.1 ABC transporter permease [Phaeovibrio sulfidiphilus]